MMRLRVLRLWIDNAPPLVRGVIVGLVAIPLWLTFLTVASAFIFWGIPDEHAFWPAIRVASCALGLISFVVYLIVRG